MSTHTYVTFVIQVGSGYVLDVRRHGDLTFEYVRETMTGDFGRLDVRDLRTVVCLAC